MHRKGGLQISKALRKEPYGPCYRHIPSIETRSQMNESGRLDCTHAKAREQDIERFDNVDRAVPAHEYQDPSCQSSPNRRQGQSLVTPRFADQFSTEDCSYGVADDDGHNSGACRCYAFSLDDDKVQGNRVQELPVSAVC